MSTRLSFTLLYIHLHGINKLATISEKNPYNGPGIEIVELPTTHPLYKRENIGNTSTRWNNAHQVSHAPSRCVSDKAKSKKLLCVFEVINGASSRHTQTN